MSWPFDRSLDPTTEYTTIGFALLSELLVRPLMNYRHVDGDAGLEVVPDLADAMPEISDDGLTYQFHIREGVRFGPPIDREVTSQDVAYAFERAAAPSTRAQYIYYLDSAIAGMEDFESGSADTISGIETPDDQTIVFHLLQPTGDFLYRLTLPATAPIPPEVGRCFDSPGDYGTHLVSSGPFMIEGSDRIDRDPCAATAATGMVPGESLSLVRNPDYNPDTDDRAIRSPGFDAYHLTIDPDESKIVDRIVAGRVDLPTDDVGIDTVRRFVTDRGLRSSLHVEDGDRLWYIAMNLVTAPFDDLHVRRAVNYVMDKDLLQRSWGGETVGRVATSILPPDLMSEDRRDPYPSKHHEGDVAAARREMALSRYDEDGDGICDTDSCKGVLHISRTDGQWEAIDEVVTESLAKIGIELDTRTPDDLYSYIADARASMAITSAPSWVKDYPDPFAVLGFLLSSDNITTTDNYNYSLVGLTRDKARELGIDVPRADVPSIDGRIAACVAIADTEARRVCWSELDGYVMEDVAPWVPYLDVNRLIVTSGRVDYVFDRAIGEVSFAHLSLLQSQ